MKVREMPATEKYSAHVEFWIPCDAWDSHFLGITRYVEDEMEERCWIEVSDSYRPKGIKAKLKCIWKLCFDPSGYTKESIVLNADGRRDLIEAINYPLEYKGE